MYGAFIAKRKGTGAIINIAVHGQRPRGGDGQHAARVHDDRFGERRRARRDGWVVGHVFDDDIVIGGGHTGGRPVAGGVPVGADRARPGAGTGGGAGDAGGLIAQDRKIIARGVIHRCEGATEQYLVIAQQGYAGHKTARRSTQTDASVVDKG